MAEERDPAEVLAALRAKVGSVQLATVDADGEPHCGYTPFAYDGAALVVLVSRLSVHTRDLLATGRCGADADRGRGGRRQALRAHPCDVPSCRAERVARDTGDWEILLGALHERHGKMIGLLRQLPDFELFRLRPVSGQFVMGFGKAYRLSGESLDTFEHATSG